MVQAKYLLAPVALASGVFASTIKVSVGPGDSFSPNSVKAAVGDVVEFNFEGRHNVAQGSFSEPCKSSSTDIFSGTMSSGVFSVKINSTDPIWYYCGYLNHCQVGMVGVINPDSHSIDDYQSASAKTSSSSTPSKVQGGIVGDASLFGSSSSASSASSSKSSASASSASASSASATGGTSTTGSSSGTATAATTSASKTANAAASVKGFGLAGVAGIVAAIVA